MYLQCTYNGVFQLKLCISFFIVVDNSIERSNILHRCFCDFFFQSAVMGNVSEPIYENVPLPWPSSSSHPPESGSGNNGAEGRSRASSIQSAPEMNNVTISSNIDRNNVTNITITEERKLSADGNSTSEHKTTFSNPSSTGSSSTSRLTSSANHSANTSIGVYFVHSSTTAIDDVYIEFNRFFFIAVADSSTQQHQHFDSNHSGTLGKDRAHKGRRKWGGILGGAKHKHGSRHDDDAVDGVRTGGGGLGLHDTLPKHPLPITISKEAMVSKVFFFIAIIEQ